MVLYVICVPFFGAVGYADAVVIIGGASTQCGYCKISAINVIDTVQGTVFVDGALAGTFYEIDAGAVIVVNNIISDESTLIYENFSD